MDDEMRPMLQRERPPHTEYNIYLTWGAAFLWIIPFVAAFVVFLVLFLTKGGESADDIIEKYNLTGHDLIGGGHFREIVRTGNMTIIYYLQQHHDTTLHRLYNGTAEESIVWIDGDDALIDDNGKFVTIGQYMPAYVVEHDGSNWLDYNIDSGWTLLTITFVPPFDHNKLSIVD
jgi:predicted cupin superfamily sugar epimerase